jgi:hypothetical protein
MKDGGEKEKNLIGERGQEGGRTLRRRERWRHFLLSQCSRMDSKLTGGEVNKKKGGEESRIAFSLFPSLLLLLYLCTETGVKINWKKAKSEKTLTKPRTGNKARILFSTEVEV